MLEKHHQNRLLTGHKSTIIFERKTSMNLPSENIIKHNVPNSAYTSTRAYAIRPTECTGRVLDNYHQNG
jgi:hypothetical protein